MADMLAAGYHGPPELTPLRALTEWAADPWALAVLVLVAAAYLAGVIRLRRSGGTWPAGRMIAFFAGGVGLAAIATSSFLAVYWPVLFYVRATQTIILLLAVPLFVALGRPLTLVIAAAPRIGPRLRAAATGPVAGLLTFPAITAMTLVLTPFLLYFTAWYQAGFHSVLVRDVTSAALVLPGLIFFWTLLRVDPVPREFPYLVALWVTAAEVVGDAALGLSVIADHNLIAGPYYHLLARPWGPSLASDQVIGGGVLWILGDLIGLPFLAAVLIAMIREDESEARTIDAQLDAEEAATSRALDDGSAQSGVLLAQPLTVRPGPARPDPAQADAGRSDTAQADAGGSDPAQADAGWSDTAQADAGRSDAAQADAGRSGATRGDGGKRPWWEADPRFRGRFAPVDRQDQPGD